MKTMNKIVGIVLALTLLVVLSTSVFATDITISGGAAGSEYAAYQLLNATDGGDGKYAYTLNDKYTAVLQTVTGAEEQADILSYINHLDSAEKVEAFAKAVYEAILADTALTPDYTTDNDTMSVAQGYYLFVETKLGDASDTYSLGMLDTAGEDAVTIYTKEDKPTVEKKVEEKNDSTGASSWGDGADYDVGDVINYKLTGTVSNKYASYDSYYYSFVDEMTAGLTYNEGSAKVYLVNEGSDPIDITDSFVFETESVANGFTATSNLKEISGVTITGDSKIVIEYTATLNENAVKGDAGNMNSVYLEYENDPYHKADGDNNPDTPNEPNEPGKTTIDVTIVFTFDVVVDKIDAEKAPLVGAGFTLYKYSDAAKDWVAVGEELKGDQMTTFTFPGVDAGDYKLVETTVPEGYNKCDDIVFTVVGIYEEGEEHPILVGLEVRNEGGEVISEGEGAAFSTTLSLGEVATSVINNHGTELPETGGIGTTIFTIAGAILVLGTVVFLVTKKRMGAEG